MAIFKAAGDTIAGDKVYVQTRKWTPGAYVLFDEINKKLYRYHTDRNSKAVVEKSTDVSIPNNYHKEVGDELQCDSLNVYVDCRRTIRISNSEGMSHRHGGNYCDINKFTIARISMPFQNAMKELSENLSRALYNKSE